MLHNIPISFSCDSDDEWRRLYIYFMKSIYETHLGWTGFALVLNIRQQHWCLSVNNYLCWECLSSHFVSKPWASVIVNLYIYVRMFVFLTAWNRCIITVRKPSSGQGNVLHLSVILSIRAWWERGGVCPLGCGRHLPWTQSGTPQTQK